MLTNIAAYSDCFVLFVTADIVIPMLTLKNAVQIHKSANPITEP